MKILKTLAFALTCMISTIHCIEKESVEFILNFEGTQTVDLKFIPRTFEDTEGKCKQKDKPRWCPTLVGHKANFNPQFPEEKATILFKGGHSEEYYVIIQEPKEVPESSTVTFNCKFGVEVLQTVEAGFVIIPDPAVCPGDPKNDVKCQIEPFIDTWVKFTGTCKTTSFTFKGAPVNGKKSLMTVKFVEIKDGTTTKLATTAASKTTAKDQDDSSSEQITSISLTKKISAGLLALLLLTDISETQVHENISIAIFWKQTVISIHTSRKSTQEYI